MPLFETIKTNAVTQPENELINIIQATDIPKLTALTHFWLSSSVSFIGF